MSCSLWRLGPQLWELAHKNFRKVALTLTAAAAIGGPAALVASPARAQESLTQAQCTSAKGATIATLDMFKGKMSAPFAQSLGEFAKTCDLKTKFNRVPGQDDEAWDVFRLQITNIKISATEPMHR